MLYFWYLSTWHEILLLEYFSCEWFQLLLTSHSNTMSLLLLRWNFWVLLATLIETDVRIKYSSDVYLSKCTSLHSSTIIHCTCFRINQQLAAVDSWWWYFGGGCASCASLRAAASHQTRSPAASRGPNQDQIRTRSRCALGEARLRFWLRVFCLDSCRSRPAARLCAQETNQLRLVVLRH